MDNLVDKAILAATNELLQEPDIKLMKDVADLINSRSDMPKLAITSIGLRVGLLRKPKVQLLTLELIEYCTYLCETTFYTQVSTSDFLQRFNAVLNPSMNQQVQQRALQILAVLKSLMGSNTDLFPTFFMFLAKVQQKLQIPTNYESKYVGLRKQLQSKSTASAQIAVSSGGSENPKTAKLKKDLEIVKSNILLTNEIIDNSNPQEDATKNDILSDMVKTLKGVEDKLRSLITNMTGSDEVMMSYCLELNDDLMKTFERYEMLKKHRKPNPFKMEQFAFTNLAVKQQPAQEAPVQSQPQESKKVDWSQFQQQLTSSQQQPTPVQATQPKPAPQQQINLLDLFEDTGPSPDVNIKLPQQQQQTDLFSIDLSPSTQQNNQQQPQQQVQAQYSNNINQQQQLQSPQLQQSTNLQSLYNQSPPVQQPQQQQQQQQPVNKYAVFNQQAGGIGMANQGQVGGMYPGQQQMNIQPQQQQQLQQQQYQQQQMMLQQQQRGQVGQFQGQPQGQMNFGAQGGQQQGQPQFQQQQNYNQPQFQQQLSQPQYPQQQQQQQQNNFQQPLAYNQPVPAVNQNPKQPFDNLDDLFGGSITKQPTSNQPKSGSGQSDLI